MKGNTSRGSLTVEALILVPALMMLFLLIVHVGRLTDASFRVHRAADVSARVASQSNSNSMISRGVAAAHNDLVGSTSTCERANVLVTRGHIGRIQTVTTSITCVVSTSGLGLLSLPQRTVRATSTEVVDYFSGR
ncbi:MAG: pilus assembly protein [Actinobacteria bacterium]|nr:pilus assembly protein [Actinomycetota bacterium]